MIYKTNGVCCKEIHFEIENGVIKELDFINGCDGNLKGIAELAKGRKPADIISAIQGIDCKGRGTSCPAQLAAALKSVL